MRDEDVPANARQFRNGRPGQPNHSDETPS